MTFLIKLKYTGQHLKIKAKWAFTSKYYQEQGQNLHSAVQNWKTGQKYIYLFILNLFILIGG